jgi:hypothetical protein
MPSNYISTKSPLPNSPENLQENYKNFFPIRKRSQLANLKEAIDSLKVDYFVPSRLPDDYFDLPPPKFKLPGDYRDLPFHLSQMFPVLDSREDLIKAANTLRENDYAVIKIPKDYIIQKRILPPAHWFAENNERTLPITDQLEADNLINELKLKYFFSLPLNNEWISENLIQNSKPPLPNDINQILLEFNLTEKPNKDQPNFDQIIKSIKTKYNFIEFPKDWTTSTIPTSLTLIKRYKA